MKTPNEHPNAVLKLKCALERKQVPSKLDPFTEQLLRMDTEKKTLNEMLIWLAGQGMETSDSTLSDFLISRRRRREVETQLDLEKEVLLTVQQWNDANPNPSLEAVMERLKMLAINLSMTKEAAPEVLRLADRLSQTAIRFVSAQSRETNDRSREDYRRRKLVMEEAKHAEWVKYERTRAMELCLDESKKYPDIANMYRAAFDALRKRRKENGEWD